MGFMKKKGKEEEEDSNKSKALSNERHSHFHKKLSLFISNQFSHFRALTSLRSLN